MGTNLAAKPFVSVEEYIERFVYGAEKPICEFIDGLLIPKAMGTKPHATVQTNVVFYIRSLYPAFNPLTELSTRQREGEFRVPDIAVERMAHGIQGDYPGPGDPCYLCIEVKSPTDQLASVLAKWRLIIRGALKSRSKLFRGRRFSLPAGRGENIGNKAAQGPKFLQIS